MLLENDQFKGKIGFSDWYTLNEGRKAGFVREDCKIYKPSLVVEG